MTLPTVNTINSLPYDFYFLVVDEFLSIDLPELTNFFIISPKILGITLDIKNSGKLLSHPKTIEYIKENSKKTGKSPAIIPFKPSSKIETVCQQQQWLLIANSAKTNRFLEDKIQFAKICTHEKIPVVDHIISTFTLKNYQQAVSKFGPKMVIQTHFGWAGNSSFLTNSFQDVASLITTDTPVKYSPYLDGYSLINNCCQIKGGVIQSPPGLQYTGLPSLTQNPLATVGRQWPCFAPSSVIVQVKNITDNFSNLLAKYQYLGFFGLDFLVSDNQVYLLECNPRLTASFAFYTQIELRQQINPLFLLHLLQFVSHNYHLDIFQERQRFDNQQIIGSEITKKDNHGTTISKYHDFASFTTNPDSISIDSKILENLE